MTLSKVWDGSAGEEDGQFELKPKKYEMRNWLQEWVIYAISPLERLYQESKLFRVITFKAEKCTSFIQTSKLLEREQLWILNKWKLVATRLVMLSRIIQSSGGNSTNCVPAHTKLVVWWTTNFVSNDNISLCDTEIPKPREISGYTFWICSYLK